jgi:signal peptidase II
MTSRYNKIKFIDIGWSKVEIKNRTTWAAVLFLVTIEQGIKVVINYNFLDTRIPILTPILYFEPMFNRDYSWINSMFQLGIGKGIHIATVVIMAIFIYLFYQYLNQQSITGNILNVLYAFLFSGTLCSLIDKVFWDGSLDYILVSGLFTFDLKDVYINIFIWLLILSLLLRNKALMQIDDHVARGFAKYILRKPR